MKNHLRSRSRCLIHPFQRNDCDHETTWGRRRPRLRRGQPSCRHRNLRRRPALGQPGDNQASLSSKPASKAKLRTDSQAGRNHNPSPISAAADSLSLDTWRRPKNRESQFRQRMHPQPIVPPQTTHPAPPSPPPKSQYITQIPKITVQTTHP